MNKIVRERTLLPLCILVLCAMGACVQSSKSYASSHPMDGLQLKMTYCMEMQRYENKPMEDVGCKVGKGNGKRGVQTDVLKKVVERLNMNKESPAYKMLVSNAGMPMTFVDESLGSKTRARVWQDGNGRLYYVFDEAE